MEILSPLTLTNDVILEKTIDKAWIIDAYNQYNIDTSAYFTDIERVSIYRCNATGYRFFYPMNLSGNSAFYEHFQQFDWYYMPWKWEHEITQHYIQPGMSLLEVGCAHGAFIQRINEHIKLKRIVGLELNETTVKKTDQWEIRNETVQTFAETNQQAFDLVCSFQVLEHISDVHGFLKTSIDCLQIGGTLIISVPNNDSFIKDSDNCLNMPPHHMGLWNEASLRALEKVFPIQVIKIHFEELQEYHLSNFLHSVHYARFSPLTAKIIRKWHKMTGIYSKRLAEIRKKRQSIIGHTILASFKKIA